MEIISKMRFKTKRTLPIGLQPTTIPPPLTPTNTTNRQHKKKIKLYIRYKTIRTISFIHLTHSKLCRITSSHR